MQLNILKVGKTAKDYNDLTNKYLKFLTSLKDKVQVQELMPSQDISKYLQSDLPQILLTEHGKQMDSIEFAKFLEKQTEQTGKVQLIIGDAFGFTPEFRAKFPLQIGLSELTLTHDMAYLVLLEQLYRARTIMLGKEYHY